VVKFFFMATAVEQLVRETSELTGSPLPGLLSGDGASLAADALSAEVGFYLVGLIGGKEVGKSALVNALLGRTITDVSSHGPGTERAICYVYRPQAGALGELLERNIPGQYTIVTHDEAALATQVLLDLPDIDSRFASHLDLTRKMLRHMLYPVWVGSVEKYADRQPQQMLAEVAAGNAAENFVFCLSKMDQLDKGEGSERALAELREDYAGRIARTLKLAAPPAVFLVSALQPQRFDLPALREQLGRSKTTQTVRTSQSQAIRRQEQTLGQWLAGQDLVGRADRLTRLAESAQEMLAERVGAPLLEEIVPALQDNPAHRAALADEAMNERVARWPMVNLVHTLLAPLLMLGRGLAGSAGAAGPMPSARGVVEQAIRSVSPPLSRQVQAVFATLRQTLPVVADLYAGSKPWEDFGADQVVAQLQDGLAATLDRQRERARGLHCGAGAWCAAPVRWLLTIGALLWFPFVQPILHAVLAISSRPSWPWIGAQIVDVLGVDYLLRSAIFLLIYYTVLWLALRWNTQRRVKRLLRRMAGRGGRDEEIDLSAASARWMERLLAPILETQDRAKALADRAAKFLPPVDA
jgi:hypothetical protein